MKRGKISKINSGNILVATRIVRHGGLIVYPTDTVYGLGCDPTNSAAVDRLFRAKQREAKPIPILVSGLAEARRFVEFDGLSLELARRHWPGALTLVLPLKTELPFLVHQGSGTVGVRMPALKTCLDLLSSCGGSLTGTSANISGHPSSRTAKEAESEMGEAVDLILDGGTLAGKESTVVRVSEGSIEVLRKGSVRVTDAVDTS